MDSVVTPSDEPPASQFDAREVPSGDTARPEPIEEDAPPRFGTGLAQAPESAIVQMDPQGLITSLNTVAERLFSIREHASAGRPYTEVFGASLATRILRLFLRAAHATNQDHLQMISAKRADGAALTLRATVSIKHDDQGAMIGFIFIAEEVVAATPAPSRETIQAAGGSASTSETGTLHGIRPPTPSNAAMCMTPTATGILQVRRVITILHAEARPVYPRASAMEPPALAALRARYHHAAVASLQTAGAAVDQSTAGTIVALWNAPAEEASHARRGLAGALALQASVGALGCELRYAIGIHTGEAEVRNIGTDQAPLYAAAGPTAHVAAALQRQTAPGNITCSGDTLAAAGAGLRHVALGPCGRNGREQGVDAFTVLGIAP